MRRLFLLLFLSGCGLTRATDAVSSLSASVERDLVPPVARLAESATRTSDSADALLGEIIGLVALASTWGKSAARALMKHLARRRGPVRRRRARS